MRKSQRGSRPRREILRVICPDPDILQIQRRPKALARAVPLKGRGAYSLDAARSHDPDGRIAAYQWFFDGKDLSGKKKPDDPVPIKADGSVHRIDLTVTDDDGLSSFDSLLLVRLPAQLLFCFDCRALSSDGQNEIDGLRDDLARTGFVRIDGHADFVGSNEYNFALSRDRACAVARSLAGSPRPNATKFEVYAHGEDSPIAPGQTSAARARNRRVEILLDDTRTPPIPRNGERVRCSGRMRSR
jgi:outer membrane protein OmpA-like peptidoglycan-associated protein